MNEDAVQKIIADAGGVARTADFNAAGYANSVVAEMCRLGLIVRVRSGYYALPTESQQEEAIVAQLYWKVAVSFRAFFSVSTRPA